tara:strand:+ start:373 stop:534 length:162 start_codon:yes stop_codon:yes gene_type:complete
MAKKCKKGWVFDKNKNKCIEGIDLLALARKTKLWGRTKGIRKKLGKAGIEGLQ